MKFKAKYSHVFIFSLVFYFFVNTQSNLNAQILIGPKAGARMSWVAFEDSESKDIYNSTPVVGYSAGIATAFKVRERFFLHADFMYARKGKKIKNDGGASLNNKSIYHYFSIPILYRVDFKSGASKNQFRWFLGVGPNIDFWWKGKGTLEADELLEYTPEPLEYDVHFDKEVDPLDYNGYYIDKPNRVQLGVLFAAGMVFEPAPNQTFLVELRYEWGHSYLARGEGEFPLLILYKDDLKTRNQGLQLSISYLFDTKIADRKKGKSTYPK